MPSALTRATYSVSGDEMRRMVLDVRQLPPELRSFQVLREGFLDNRAMAEQGFPGHTEEALRKTGRSNGYLREFGNAAPGSGIREGTELAAATVVHLFDDEDAVGRWMTEVFLREFEENIGKAVAPGLDLVAAEGFEPPGFADKAVGLRAVQRGPIGLMSSTVTDFRVGRLLGVAYVVASGDCSRRELAEAMGRELERQMVRVVLGAA